MQLKKRLPIDSTVTRLKFSKSQCSLSAIVGNANLNIIQFNVLVRL